MTVVEPLAGKSLTSVHLATGRINLWEGSVRSSKTVSSLVRWLQFVRTGPAGNLAMVGRTERTLKRNIIDPLIEWLGPKRCKYTQGTGEVILLGRRIYVAGADNEASVTKIQGLTLAGAYVDEVTTIPESFWSMLLTRLSVDDAAVFGTCNPDNPEHWLLKNYLSKATVHVTHQGDTVRDDGPDALSLARFSFNLRDNPHLSKAYVDALGKEFTGLWRKRFIEGLWVAAEGAIYDMLEAEVHQTHADPEAGSVAEWILALDYGTTNPFHAVLLAVTDDGVTALREWRWDSKVAGRQLTDAEYSAKLAAWVEELRLSTFPDLRLAKTIVDPSAASFIAQLWRDDWPGVTQANNKVLNGIRITSTLFTLRRLNLHASCTHLWAELTGYVWDPKAAQRGEEKPIKVADHGADALRYGIQALRPWWRQWIISAVDEDAQRAA